MTDVVPQRDREARIAALRLEECEARIEESRKAAKWHGLFAVLGVSPASLIPMVGLGIDFGALAIVGVSAFVVSLETWRYLRARSEVREGEAERDRLLSGRQES